MKNIRVLGIDDSHFEPHTNGRVDIVGVVMRLSGYIDGFLKRSVQIDGHDSTDKIIDMLFSKYGRDIKVVMTQGITVGGFNVIDLEKIHEITGKKVISISRKKPDMYRINKALISNFQDWNMRWDIINKIPVEPVSNGEYTLYIQRAGIDIDEAKYVIRKITLRGAIPEPVRIAHLVASALYYGESTGKP